MTRVLRAAVVQMSSQEDVPANLASARALASQAADRGARLVVLPENFAFMGDEGRKGEIAETLDERPKGPIGRSLGGLAEELGLWLVAGGMPERSNDVRRPYNTSALFAPDGRVVGRYRKVHLFDVTLSDGTTLEESRSTTRGDAPVVGSIDDGGEVSGIRLGMSICYDLRFPELFRRLVDGGARILSVPSAFTITTGKDHWHVLLRARAIENQVFMLAAAQYGRHPKGRQTYGKSLIVDPWGDVLAQCPEGEGVAVADLDLDAQDRVRRELPCLVHRRL